MNDSRRVPIRVELVLRKKTKYIKTPRKQARVKPKAGAMLTV